MDPFEQRLINEVIYLHSLWHQGPPRKPNPIPYNNPLKHLQPSSSTQFKEKKRTRGKRGGKERKKPSEFDLPPASDKPWPCEVPAETPPETTSGWPNLKPHLTRATRLPSAEEQARFSANRMQQKGLKAAQEFFASNAGSDGDSDSDEDMEDEDDTMNADGCEEYKFFLKVFVEDAEFRGFYEKNYECGDFCCLVCGGIGKKVGKRFKDSVALVQHSIAIGKTKKKRAHRAFGQVICKVLGWDISRLPTIVFSSAGPLSLSLAKSSESQGNPDGGLEEKDTLKKIAGSENVNSELVLNGNSDVGQKEELHNGSVVSDDLMVCENSLNVSVANESMEDIERGVSSNVDGNSEGVVNCLEPFKGDGVGSVGDEINNNQKDIIISDGQKEDDKDQN